MPYLAHKLIIPLAQIAYLWLIAVTPTAVASTTPPIQQIVLPPVMARIALCESGDRADARNPHSSAKGRFQFLDGTWNYYGKQLWGDELKDKDPLNWDDSTELAAYVYKINGTRDWLASYNCWK